MNGQAINLDQIDLEITYSFGIALERMLEESQLDISCDSVRRSYRHTLCLNRIDHCYGYAILN